MGLVYINIMANLITEKQKIIVKREYYVRLVTVFLFFPVTLLGVFILAYIIPYYLSLVNKDLIVMEQFRPVINVENKENVGKSLTQIVNQTNDELRALEVYNLANIAPSVYFNKIISNKNSDIQITKLSFSNTGKDQGLFVSGVARNREGLVDFIEDLKFKAGFAGVDSPISDFAKDSNIAFTLNIKVAI